MVTVTSVAGVMNMGKSVPRVEIEPTSMALQVSVLIISRLRRPDVTMLSTLTSLW